MSSDPINGAGGGDAHSPVQRSTLRHIDVRGRLSPSASYMMYDEEDGSEACGSNSDSDAERVHSEDFGIHHETNQRDRGIEPHSTPNIDSVASPAHRETAEADKHRPRAPGSGKRKYMSGQDEDDYSPRNPKNLKRTSRLHEYTSPDVSSADARRWSHGMPSAFSRSASRSPLVEVRHRQASSAPSSPSRRSRADRQSMYQTSDYTSSKDSYLDSSQGVYRPCGTFDFANDSPEHTRVSLDAKRSTHRRTQSEAVDSLCVHHGPLFGESAHAASRLANQGTRNRSRSPLADVRHRDTSSVPSPSLAPKHGAAQDDLSSAVLKPLEQPNTPCSMNKLPAVSKSAPTSPRAGHCPCDRPAPVLLPQKAALIHDRHEREKGKSPAYKKPRLVAPDDEDVSAVLPFEPLVPSPLGEDGAPTADARSPEESSHKCRTRLFVRSPSDESMHSAPIDDSDVHPSPATPSLRGRSLSHPTSFPGVDSPQKSPPPPVLPHITSRSKIRHRDSPSLNPMPPLSPRTTPRDKPKSVGRITRRSHSATARRSMPRSHSATMLANASNLPKKASAISTPLHATPATRNQGEKYSAPRHRQRKPKWTPYMQTPQGALPPLKRKLKAPKTALAKFVHATKATNAYEMNAVISATLHARSFPVGKKRMSRRRYDVQGRLIEAQKERSVGKTREGTPELSEDNDAEDILAKKLMLDFNQSTSSSGSIGSDCNVTTTDSAAEADNFIDDDYQSTPETESSSEHASSSEDGGPSPSKCEPPVLTQADFPRSVYAKDVKDFTSDGFLWGKKPSVLMPTELMPTVVPWEAASRPQLVRRGERTPATEWFPPLKATLTGPTSGSPSVSRGDIVVTAAPEEESRSVTASSDLPIKGTRSLFPSRNPKDPTAITDFAVLPNNRATCSSHSTGINVEDFFASPPRGNHPATAVTEVPTGSSPQESQPSSADIVAFLASPPRENQQRNVDAEASLASSPKGDHPSSGAAETSLASSVDAGTSLAGSPRESDIDEMLTEKHLFETSRTTVISARALGQLRTSSLQAAGYDGGRSEVFNDAKVPTPVVVPVFHVHNVLRSPSDCNELRIPVKARSDDKSAGHIRQAPSSTQRDIGTGTNPIISPSASSHKNQAPVPHSTRPASAHQNAASAPPLTSPAYTHQSTRAASLSTPLPVAQETAFCTPPAQTPATSYCTPPTATPVTAAVRNPLTQTPATLYCTPPTATPATALCNPPSETPATAGRNPPTANPATSYLSPPMTSQVAAKARDASPCATWTPHSVRKLYEGVLKSRESVSVGSEPKRPLKAYVPHFEDKEWRKHRHVLEPDASRPNDVDPFPSKSCRVEDFVFLSGGDLGRGSFGTVKRVRHRPTGKIFALKRTADRVSCLTEWQSSVFELLAMKRIGKHENIVEVLAAWQEDGFIYYLMPLYDGAFNVWPPKEMTAGKSPGACFAVLEPYLWMLLFNVGDALSCVHKAGMVHMDMKPQNILYRKKTTGGYSFHLTDFGQVRGMDGVYHKDPGDFTYQPQERGINEKNVYTYADDIFCLGKTMFEVMIGTLIPSRHFNVRSYAFAKEYLNQTAWSRELRKLVASMLNDFPKRRPRAKDVMHAAGKWLNEYQNYQ